MANYRRPVQVLLLSALTLLLVVFANPAGSQVVRSEEGSWPAYRANASRTALHSSSLAAELAPAWIYQSAAAPQPAWPRSERMPFDRAQQTVVAQGKVFFGSSVDGRVMALDLETGKLVWTFMTDGPIRFAPAVWKDRLLLASDDGFIYALAIADGRQLWKKRGGPDGRMVMGNGRLISKWPARGGPVVVDDTLYVAAGIWPTDGIYLYALNPEDGETIWLNSESGSIYMAQPHGGASATSGASAQGYLVVSGDRLLVPTGRAIPASFNRKDGKLEFFHLQKYGHNGGTPTMAIGDMFFNSGLGFNTESGDRVASLGTGQLAAIPGGMVRAVGSVVTGYRFIEVEKPDRKGNLVKTRALEQTWQVKGTHTDASLVVAGQQVISGGNGHVDVIDIEEKKVVQSFPVDGTAYGLAVAAGRLLVSTDKGEVYCFAASAPESVVRHREKLEPSPYGENAEMAAYAQAIITRTGIQQGFCVDYGCGDGSLALELARRTDLHVFAIGHDEVTVQQARDKLIQSGLYGSRITVLLRPRGEAGLPPYVADLVVSQRSHQQAPAKDWINDELRRIQRPHGGTICVGAADSLLVDKRGALEGEGSWTHQYANAANTVNSQDNVIRGSLSMLWYRDIDFDIPQRHGRAPSPLYDRGRLLHEGLNGIIAVDAYTGREIWRHEIKGLLKAYDGDELMGVSGTGSNFCIHGDSVYIRDETRCLKLDVKTGALQAEFMPPKGEDGKPSRWGYIACVDGILYGSVADTEHIVTYRYVNRGGDMSRLLTESKSLFAMDAGTGRLLWHYQATNSIRHNAIGISAGKVCLVDRPLALFDRVKKPESKFQSTGTLLALDARSGKVLWRNEEDIYGTTLAISGPHKAIVMSYQPTRFRLDSEVGGRISVLGLEDGKRLWDVEANYTSRPMINDRTIYAQGGAWDVLSGEAVPFNFSRSYGCGILAGSSNMMVFRSATLGYFDFAKNKEVSSYGGMRPGCWVNALPVGGIVLVPDASAGCRCSYLNRAWIALHGEE
jgi:outer membrane protein assembly factor BamB